jgi:Zn-dependent peptidase ImmA (M78 family)
VGRARRWLGREARLLEIIMGDTDAARAMQRRAQELLEEAEVTEPPFDLARVASYRGVRVIRQLPMSTDARLVPEVDGLAVEVNVSHTRGKRRFSIAHEVAHTLLPGYSGEAVYDDTTGSYAPANEDEALCDVGAATLLLDPRQLRKLASDADPTLATVLALANLFDASLQATASQLAALNVWRCAFVIWEKGYRKAEQPQQDAPLLPGLEAIGRVQPRLRVRVCYPSAGFPHFIPSNKSAPFASIVVSCQTESRSVWGVETFDFGQGPVRLTCESLYAPYAAHGTMRERVLSIFLPSPIPAPRAPAVIQEGLM